MCPTYAFINRSDGKFNSGMGFGREYSAILSAIWDNDYALSQYLNDPEADTYETLRRLGIKVSPTDEEEAGMLHDISQNVLAGVH